MDKMKMHTVDITDSNIEKIGQLFPNCLTERIGEDGNVEKVIDFNQLRQELSKEIVEGPQERYQFTWPDKKKAIRLANTPSSMTLRPCREESVDFDNTENLYVEGDNLEVLKLLREDYLGKVKMIYIDPPYNTGNDFVYEDDFAISASEYSEISGQTDEYGNRLFQNTESNGRFHTDWLNMMYPRLKASRDLLSEEGVIFVSIADGEVANLKKLLNEIYGESNFIAQMNIITGANQSGEGVLIQKNVEYCLVYAKSILSAAINRVDRTDESYRNLNDAPTPLETRPDMGYTIYYNASTGELIPAIDYDKSKISCNDESKLYQDDSHLIANGFVPIRPGRRNGKLHRWRWGIDTFKERINEVKIFEVNGRLVPKFLQSGFNAPKNIQNFSGGAFDLKKLFGDNTPFDYPKGLPFMKYLCSIGLTSNDIVLDFFSGSATTAHAVIELNGEDAGSRRFILVQLPEGTDPKSEAYKAGFKNICEIGKERIRRAGKKILEEQEKSESDGGLFAKTESKPKVDVGFRVLKLDSSNMQDVYYRPEESNETTLFEDNIKPDRTPEDLLFQVMLECNLPLSAKIETKKIAGKEVFSVNNGYLIACFDEDVNEATITAVAKRKPYYFIMRDKSLSSDNVADNFEQIFQAYSKETIRRIL